MSIEVFRTSRSSPVTLPAAVPIHDGLAVERVSVSAAPLPPLVVRFVVTVTDAPQEIRSVQAVGDRIYVAGRMVWKLLDARTGKEVARGIRGLGEGLLDAALPLLYQPDREGQLDGLHCDAGQRVFWSPLHLANNLLRNDLARVGESLLLLGSERHQPGMGDFEPSLTCLDAVTVGPVPDVRPSGQLSASLSRPLLWKSVRCVAGAWTGGLAVAFPEEVHLVDESLEVTAVLTGDFAPVAISVDGTGVLHLLVDEPGPRRALWVVTQGGVRTLREVLPWNQTEGPPVALPGGDVVVRGPAGLLRIGRARWELPLSPGGGAAVLSGDTLLATDGSDLISIDDSGRRTVVHHFPDHQLRGPPVVGANGEITVTTRTAVLRLGAG